jgi:predicted nucleic acid-binding protein
LTLFNGDAYDVVRVSRDGQAKAIELIIGHRDKVYSLCNARSFVVRERLRILEAIAFDEDFRGYGRFAVP